MTKTLPIGSFKKRKSVTLEILNDVIKNYNSNCKVGHIYLVDIEFCEYGNPPKKKKKMYSSLAVRFPPIIEVFISFYQQCGLEIR